MKHFGMNDEGIGYNILILGIAGFGATMAAIVMAPIMGSFVTYGNGLVGGSLHVSAQTLNTFGFLCGLFAMLPVFILVGFLLKAYLLGSYERENQRGGIV